MPNKLYLHTDFSKSLDPELLRSLGLFHQLEHQPLSKDYDYSLELNKYGKIIQKKLSSLNLNKCTSGLIDGFLIYKYLNPQQHSFIQSELAKSPHLKLYILANKLIDVCFLLKTLSNTIQDKTQVTILIAADDYRLGNSISYTDSEISYFLDKNHGYDLVSLVKSENIEKSKTQDKKSFFHNFIFTSLFKFLIAPLEQIENGLNSMKVSKFVWIKRVYELLFFLSHSRLILKNIYYFLKPRINYIFLKIEIFAKYRISHIVLKSYGLGVDAYYRIKGILMHTFYFLRHRTLMSIFKTYGFLVDSTHIFIMFSRRAYYLLKRTLFYPIRKIYWMFEYQYKKRIKKSL